MGDENDNRSDRAAIGRMVFDAALAIIVAATGYYVSGIASKLDRLDAADSQIRAEAAARAERLPLEYVRKEEYKTDIADIKRLLERIEGKVDRKADRSDSQASVRPTAPGSWRDGRDVNR
jgi:tRNA A37 N6-isopentenylltransferase MiaA